MCYAFSCISDLGSIAANLNSVTYNSEKQKRNNTDIMSLALNQDKAEIEKRMSPDSTRKLQDEINVLTKRNCELESQLRSFDSGNSRDFHFDSTDGPDSGELSMTLLISPILNALGVFLFYFRKNERIRADGKSFETTTG